MKKIAIVVNTSWNIYNFRQTLLKKLLNERYSVTCIAPKDKYSQKLEDLGCLFENIKINNKGSNPLEDFSFIIYLYKIFKKEKYDLILLYTIKPNIYGNLAAKLAGIPTISTITGLGTVFLNEYISSKIARLLYKYSLKYSKKVFFQNNDDMNKFLDEKLVNEELVAYIPGSGIDVEKFKINKNQTKDKNRPTTTFLMVARLVTDKGLMEYLNAAKELKVKYKNKISFNLLGDFYEGNPTAISKNELQVWIDKGIVNYLGYSDKVHEVMQRYDCVVLPSYREGLSRVLLEACSLEKPIVTTNVPGCKDLVDNEINGYLCKVKNSDSLANSMEKLFLDSEEKRKLMGIASRNKVVENFSDEIVVKRYLDIIPKFIKRKK